jgi:glycine cleavage system H protein
LQIYQENSMTKAPLADRLFSKEHEWISVSGDNATMGISDHAQSSLGDVVYVELPEIGAKVRRGKPIGVVESVKAVSDIYAPVSGTVKAINKAIIDHPEAINRDPYGEGWLLVIELENKAEEQSLLSYKQYEEMLTLEAKR